MFGHLIVLLAVLLVVARAYTPAETTILDYVEEYKKHSATAATLCKTNKCCTISESESCAITGFTKDESILVLPGGETRCIFSTSTPFAFQVIPGSSEKLLFYFQGGGACWDEYSTKLGLCTTDVSPQSLVGVFDRTEATNAFKDFTIVHVSYCSGDVFGGDKVQPYNDKAGVPVTQKGVANAQSALDWVKAQMANGGLSSSLSELVVMGCSAGSIGAQLWGKQVLQQLKWKTAAVIPDSYAGIFPPNSMGPLIYSYGFCNTQLASPSLMDKCLAQTLTLQDIDNEAISEIPTVPYNFIQSKVDIVQQSFYIAIGLSMNSSSKTINPTEFYDDVNIVFGDYNAKHPNFVTYLVDGDHHCFTNQALYYQADATGPNGSTEEDRALLRESLRGSRRSAGVQKLSDWTNTFPLAESVKASTVCDGTLEQPSAIAKQLAENNLRTMTDNTYCSTAVTPKTYTEHY